MGFLERDKLMAATWTKEQQKVIDTRDHNLLVSAAAGSGKTAVLVERIIGRITDEAHPVDIDRLLVVTFTKAAAAEMRERIASAIDQKREEAAAKESTGQNVSALALERQQTLIHNAQITTIDSFCLFVVRNHFEDISLDPNFRIADTGEIKLLEHDILDRVFERWYEKENNEDFLRLVDAYSASRNDQAVRDMVSLIYHQAGSNPWPKEWIAQLADNYLVESEEELLGTEAICEVAEIARMQLSDAREMLLSLRELAHATPGLEKYAATLEKDLELLEEVALEKTLHEQGDYYAIYDFLQRFQMGAIAQIRKFDGDEVKKEYIKNQRNAVKKEIEELKKKYFKATIPELFEQIRRMRPMIQTLVAVSLDYLAAMEQEKRAKRIADFSDIEHFALQIFIDEETKQLRPAAREFSNHFEEIMIDEYQDSNQVQEAIMQAISGEEEGKHKLFMVGDVKQSIYRFRLARPELFMEKYENYSTCEAQPDYRIDLHKNFRSRREVLDFTNDIFYKIMQKDLGNVAYNDEAALYCGADYPQSEGMEAEVLLYDTESADKQRASVGVESLPQHGSDRTFPHESEDNIRKLEARMIAQKIQSMMETAQIRDKETGQMRALCYKDIVILLRSLKGWDSDFAEVLEAAGIPVHVESSTGYFAAPEVQTILCFLQILDNPYQDIPMAAVLKSPIVGLSEEELAELRLSDREVPFSRAAYEAMQMAEEGKLWQFCRTYRNLRRAVCDTPIHELIQRILRETGYGNYVAAMPAGKKRAANLDMLVEKAIAYEKTSYKGLFHFVRYIEQLRKYDVDFGEADLTGENADVVHMMTIHKSKGLEFPVVFVSGISKKINQMDVNQKLVVHPDLGMGLYEISPHPRMKKNCLLRTMIAERIRRENLGEELRVLYVALTRAKEKIILTGVVNDWGKTLEKYTGKAMQGCPISYTQRVRAASYLDWVIPALCSYPGKYEPQILGAEDLVLNEVCGRARMELEREKLLQRISEADKGAVESLRKIFAYEYPYKNEAGRKSKYSVSELKHDSMLQVYDRQQNAAELPDFLKEDRERFVPEFAKGHKSAAGIWISDLPGIPQGALRGTAVHRVMECLDFAAIADLDQTDHKKVAAFVRQQLDGMRKNEQITQEMYQLVIPSMIERFVENGVARRMAEAERRGELFREKPFVMEYDTGQQVSPVLVQGIIDVFWLEGQRIVLLDYKTDRVKTAEELVLRYQKQLELYADALCRYFSRKDHIMTADEKLLYSFRLKEVIEV